MTSLLLTCLSGNATKRANAQAILGVDNRIDLQYGNVDSDEIQSLDPVEVMKHKLHAAHGAVA